MAASSKRNPEKLQQLARDANIVQLTPLANLRLKDIEIPNFITASDERHADQLINSEQSTGFLRKPTIRTKARLSAYTYKNLTIALSKAFDTSCTPGLVQALLNKEQNIAAIKNDEARRAQLEQRDAFLSTAVVSGNPDLIWVLAPQTSSTAKNKCLSLALGRRDAGIVRKLLECGADPQIAADDFLQAAEKGDILILELLLSAPKPLPNELLLEAIPFAVSSGSLQVLQRIVEFTSLDSWLRPGAVRTVAKNARLDMLLVLLIAAKQIAPDFLAEQVLEVVRRPQTSRETTLNLLQALLHAGAAGNDCSAALRIVAENRDIGMVDLLVHSGADVNWGQGVILKDVTRMGHVDLLQALLTGSNVSVESASIAVMNLPQNMQEADRLEMLRVLMDFGACGRPLEDEIVLAVQRNHINIVHLLRTKGVSVDTRPGDALVAAIQTENLGLLRKLLEGPVGQISLQNAFPHTQTVQKSSRMKFMQPFLQARVEGAVLHAALRDIVAEHSAVGVDEVIGPLLLAQADPAFENYQCLRAAIRSENAALFGKLLKCPAGISESVASSLISEVLRIENREIRPDFMRSVLQARPNPDSVSAAALALLCENECVIGMLELLVSSGMVNVNYESVLAQAAVHPDLRALSVIVSLSDVHRDTMKSAVNNLLESPIFSDDIKYERLYLLFSSARNSVRSYGAMAGLPIHLKFWQCSNTPGKHWPMRVFEYLLASRAELADNGNLLATAVSAGAVQLVKAFLLRKPVESHVDEAVPKIFDIEVSEQIPLLTLLLEAPFSSSVISQMLITAVTKSLYDLCDTLLDHGAMLEFENCMAFRQAICIQSEALTSKFLARNPSMTVIMTAFEQAKGLRDSPPKRTILRLILRAGIPKSVVNAYLSDVLSSKEVSEELVQLLLEEQANPSSDTYRSVKLATMRNLMTIASMLFEQVENHSEAASHAFDAFVSSNAITAQYLPMLTFLLRQGARGSMLNTALIKAADTHTKAFDVLPLIRMLIESGADANTSQGEALCIACHKGQLEVITAIFQSSICPNTVSRSRALQYLIDSPAESGHFCTILLLLMNSSIRSGDNRNSIPGPRFAFTPGAESPIRRFLKRRPRDQVALEKLLSCGCETLQKGTDDSILIWAMCQEPERVSTSCLKLLVEAGANVKCRSSVNNESTLHIAIRQGRNRLIKPLLDHGADIFDTNSSGVSPMLMATHHGNAQIVDILMIGGSPKDDGSLHEAVCLLQYEVAEMLLNHGHNPNFPSQLSEGRSVLAHLLCKGKVDQKNMLVARKIIELLLDNGATTMKPVSSKPLICWALDNAQPIHIVSAVLQAYLYKYIDAEFNIYYDEGYFYSPTMYVKKGKCGAPHTYTTELITLLKNFGANRDVYYHDLGGAQPPDAIGMPDELAQAERARRDAALKAEQARKDEEAIEIRKEQAHQRALIRQQEIIQAEINGTERRHRLEQAMAEEAEKAEQKRMKSRHGLHLQLQADTEQQRLSFRMREDEYLDGRRKEDLQHQKRIADDEFAAFSRKEQLRVTMQQDVETAQLRLLERTGEQEYTAQMKLEKMRAGYAKDAHKMRMEEIAMWKAVPAGVLAAGGRALPANRRTTGFVEG